jgi:hypothetical protein
MLVMLLIVMRPIVTTTTTIVTALRLLSVVALLKIRSRSAHPALRAALRPRPAPPVAALRLLSVVPLLKVTLRMLSKLSKCCATVLHRRSATMRMMSIRKVEGGGSAAYKAARKRP